MLTNMNDMLRQAYQHHYAIGSFNGYSYETFKGIVQGNRSCGNRPAIVAFGAKYLDNMSLQEASAMVRAIDDDNPEQRVCLHLDHCKDLQVIWQAIRAGFGSVMYDGSALPLEDNIRHTREVCQIAHSCGVSVEAELGSLAAGTASHEGEASDRQIYTDPQKAREFIDATQVDALAVSIGTVHGLYQGQPKIRVDILQQIDRECQIPLVLHGGSGTPPDTIQACVRNGIAKINVNTEISMEAVRTATDLLGQGQPHLSVLMKELESSVEATVRKYADMFDPR
jgi:fructose-bisphosphate aldolase class II